MGALALVCVMCVALLSACGGGSAGQQTSRGSATCAALSGFASATAASGGSSFGDVPFPQDAVATSPQQTAGGTGLYTVTGFDVCAPSTTTSTVSQFFSGHLNAQRWTQSVYFPTDGGLADMCMSGQSCWSKDTAPRFTLIERITDAGGGRVTFHVRLALPPTPPTCDTSFADGYLFYLDEQQTVPLPPLTRQGAGDVAGNLQGYGMCSAGTGDSVSAFFTKELTKLGWHQQPTFAGTNNCPVGSGSSPVWVKGSEAVQVQASGASQTWRIEFCSQM